MVLLSLGTFYYLNKFVEDAMFEVDKDIVTVSNGLAILLSSTTGSSFI